MNRKKRHWVWNVLIIITLVICILAFVLHYKNWVRLKEDRIDILSGIYYTEVPYARLEQVEMVARIPAMERINGFSAWTTEKGVFKDSINPEKKVYVYVDDLRLPKIKIVQDDSLTLYLNLSDSTQTRQLYERLTENQLQLKSEKLPVK